MRIKTRQTLVEGIVANVAKEKLVERLGILMDDYQLDQLCSGILKDIHIVEEGLTDAVRKLPENDKVKILSVEYVNLSTNSEGLDVYYKRTIEKEDGTEETDRWSKTWHVSWDELDTHRNPIWLTYQIVQTVGGWAQAQLPFFPLLYRISLLLSNATKSIGIMSRVQHVTVTRAGNDVELRCTVDDEEVAVFNREHIMLAILAGYVPPMDKLVVIKMPSHMDGRVLKHIFGLRAQGC